MAITADFLQNSVVVLMISYAVAFAFQIYVLYLNWKQSKVKDQMNQLIEEVKEIKGLLKKGKKS